MKAAAVIAVGVLLAACGGGSTEQGRAATELERLEDPPFDLSGMYRVAARGDDLVVIQDETNRAAIRWTDDGSWSVLPAIAGEGFYEFVTIGPTVVAGGYSCDGGFNDDGYCPNASTAAFRLSEDLSEWRRLDVPKESATSETELTGTIGPQALGEFQIGGLNLVIDGGGDVTAGSTNPPSESGFGCLVDGQLVDVATRPASGVPDATQQSENPEVVQAVETRPVGDRNAEWSPVNVGSEVIPSAYGLRICGAGLVSILPKDGTTEWVLDVAARTVQKIESNSLATVGLAGFTRPGEQAESPDGRTLYMASTGGIASRTGTAPWRETGIPFGGVWATDSAVWTFDGASGDFVQLPPD